MHAVAHLLGFWAAAFVTLCAALVLLNVFDGIVGGDLVLKSVRSELILAAVASLIEGASVWAVVSYLPAAGRALLIPALIVAFLYKVAHLEDWSRYHILLLLTFQGALLAISLAFCFGQWALALTVIVFFALALVVATAFLRGL
jgi:hypothetical protein